VGWFWVSAAKLGVAKFVTVERSAVRAAYRLLSRKSLAKCMGEFLQMWFLFSRSRLPFGSYR
jgi:hypothetical protein